MNEKDTNLKDGQSVPTPYRGPKASNTLESLRPREVNVFQDGSLWNTYGQAKEGGLPAIQETDNAPLQGRGTPPEQYNLLPVDWPTASETMGFKEVERAYEVLQLPLEDRVARLEDRVDGLLDRLAAYNVKSSHKI